MFYLLLIDSICIDSHYIYLDYVQTCIEHDALLIIVDDTLAYIFIVLKM